MDANMEWNICRICLQEGDMRSIFDDQTKSPTMPEKIMQCSTIIINREANYPEQICVKCINDLEVAYRFRSTCESSEAILHSIIASTKFDQQTSDCEKNDDYLYEVSYVSAADASKVETIKVEIMEPGNSDRTSTPNAIEHQPNCARKANRTKHTNRQGGRNLEEKNFEDFKAAIKDGIVTEYVIESIDHDEQADDELNTESILGYPHESNVAEAPKVSSNTSLILDDQRQKVQIKFTNIQPVKTNKTRLGRGKSSLIKSEKPLKCCMICGNTYKFQHALNSHMRRHRNEKPFKCDVCLKAFVIKFELNRHMRTHTGQKPYACKYCGRKFSDFGSRIKHERIHTGEKPYECDKCGRRFSLSHVLNSHYLVHTGEKKYQCEICDRRFSKAHHLKTHRNIHERRKDRENKIKYTRVRSPVPASLSPIQQIADGRIVLYNLETIDTVPPIEEIKLIMPSDDIDNEKQLIAVDPIIEKYNFKEDDATMYEEREM